MEKPRAIAVAPEIGWLFWSDWSDRKPKIERANLDGTERIMIVSKDLVWPNGVTLDIEARKIYWCDAKEDKIEFANMDGTDRRVLINTDVPHVFGLSLLGEYLYWTDWERRAIDRAHKNLGEVFGTFIFSSICTLYFLYDVSSIKIYFSLFKIATFFVQIIISVMTFQNNFSRQN